MGRTRHARRWGWRAAWPLALLMCAPLAATAALADRDGAGSGAPAGSLVPDAPEMATRRARMVHEVRRNAEEVRRGTGLPALDPRVLEALARVPRHRLVPEAQRAHAYANRPLPIGHGQTISQPYIVALMTDLARPRPGDRVLEIGTGSGYQAAVLAELVERVYSIEIVPPLARRAAADLQALGYTNIELREGDGYYGWPEHAPFDAIVVTAAAASIPPPLIEQLKPGGRMVIPVGGQFHTQMLMLVEKQDDGRVRSRQILPVRFVSLTGAGERR